MSGERPAQQRRSDAAATSAVGMGLPSSHNHLLAIFPDDLVFTNVRLGQQYSQSVRITNPMQVTVDFTVRAGSATRYTLSPTKFSLRGGETALLEVRLRVLTAVRPKKTAAGLAAGVHGVKDTFHIKSDLFVQTFHATWFAWGTTAPTAQPAGGSQVNHNLTNSTLAAYDAEGGAAGIRAQRTSEPTTQPTTARSNKVSRRSSKVETIEEKQEPRETVTEATVAAEAKVAAAVAAKVAEATNVMAAEADARVVAAAEAKVAAAEARLLAAAEEKLQAEIELYKPFERVSLQKKTSTNNSGSMLGSQEFLAERQRSRALQTQVDALTQEVQQASFQYGQLEREYKYVVQQLDQLHSVARVQGPAEVHAQLDHLMAHERATAESKDRKVLLVLRAKDEALRERDETIARLEAQLQQQAFDLGEQEEALAASEDSARDERARLQQIITDLQAKLVATQTTTTKPYQSFPR